MIKAFVVTACLFVSTAFAATPAQKLALRQDLEAVTKTAQKEGVEMKVHSVMWTAADLAFVAFSLKDKSGASFLGILFKYNAKAGEWEFLDLRFTP